MSETTVTTVTFDLGVVSVQLPKGGSTEKETVELAQKALIEQMKEKFPKHTYRITEGAAMSMEEANTGQLVKYKKTGEYAVISAVKPTTKYPIHFRTQSGGDLKGVPELFELLDDPNHLETVIKENLFKKRYDFMWSEGDVGYFLNGGEVLNVVIGGTTRGKTRVFQLGIKTEGKYYSLSEESMKRVFATKEEAESKLK